MNTIMTGFEWFSKIFTSLNALDESSLSIGRVNGTLPTTLLVIFCQCVLLYFDVILKSTVMNNSHKGGFQPE